MSNLFKIDLSHLRGDMLGGLTAGIVALPLALAFGAQTEMGAIAGLYGAIAVGIFAAFFGGTPIQVSGPTAPMTVISGTIISLAIAEAGSLAAAIPLVIAIFFLAGLLEMLLGVFKIGRYIKYIPYPVVSGFMSGIGVIIVVGQIFPFFGLTAPEGGAWGTLSALGSIPSQLNVYALAIATATLLIIYLFPRLTKAVPSSLVALVLLSVVSYLTFGPGQLSVINDGTPGGIPTGLPRLQLDFWSQYLRTDHLWLIFEYAITLAALGAIDSLLTSIVADNLSKTRHQSDQELIGQGIGNMAAALIGGLPGAGATMRTVVNYQAGGKTRLSGVMAGLFLLAVLLGLGKLVGHVPNAVLAGILITVGISIIDYRGFRDLNKIPRADAITIIAVLLITVFQGLLEAVGVGMIISSVLFMKSISDVIETQMESKNLKEASPNIPWDDEGDLSNRLGTHIVIKRLDGPLFFGLANQFSELARIEPQIRLVVIRLGRVPYIDQSGLYVLEEVVRSIQEQGAAVVLSGLKGQPLEMTKRINLVPGLVGFDYCFHDFQACLRWLRPLLQNESLLNSVVTGQGLQKGQISTESSGEL